MSTSLCMCLKQVKASQFGSNAAETCSISSWIMITSMMISLELKVYKDKICSQLRVLYSKLQI